MLQHFFLIALAVAGFAVIWRNLTINNTAVKAWMQKRLPPLLEKSLMCGSCFTYWLSLVATLIADPLPGWQLPLRLALPRSLADSLTLLATWMALSMVAVTIRFGYVVLQETVNGLTHGKAPHSHHHPPEQVTQ